MQHYLLTGAGFSANWGGWVASEAFEYLLGCPEILADDRLRDLLWDCQLRVARLPDIRKSTSSYCPVSKPGSSASTFVVMSWSSQEAPCPLPEV